MPERRWAGGYGYRNGRISNAGIGLAVGGRRVMIETTREEYEPTARHLIRELATDLAFQRLYALELLELPVTLTLEPADLEIIVDGVLRTFAGVALEDRWTGVTMVETNVAVTIEAPRAVIPKVLVPCRNLDVEDGEPPEMGNR